MTLQEDLREAVKTIRGIPYPIAVLIYCGAVIEYKRMEHKRKKNNERKN